jgi:predicted GIY-YIG superfamily endonuclease
MWYVYILESERYQGKFYTGFTGDLKRRLAEHNAEKNPGYTQKYKPWRLHSYTAFRNKKVAHRFEDYLKTQAGRRFLKLRFTLNDNLPS